MRLHNVFNIKLPTDKTDFTDLHGFKIILCCGKKKSESLSFFLLFRYTLRRCTAVHLYNYAYVQFYVLNWHFTIVCFFIIYFYMKL